ncbi:MAG: DNA polymerase I [Planctomycetota bacterium]
MQKRLFLIDGTALAYRSFHAFQRGSRNPLTTSGGHPTGATFGFAMTLRSLIEREKPDAIAVAFDGPRQDLHRTALYPEYKSTRQKMPDELFLQLDDIRALVEAHGIRIVESERDEADDVIGTLAEAGRRAGMEVLIVTGDKDFMQIVGAGVRLWNLRSPTGNPEILGPDEVRRKFGVPPSGMIDLLALMGDSSDNVPGVPRVGQKTAGELLGSFGSLEGIYEHIDEVGKPAIRKSLEEHREQAFLSRRLVTIRTDLDLAVGLDDLGPARPDAEALRALYRRLEFDSLLAALDRAPAESDVARDYREARLPAGAAEVLSAVRASRRCGLWLQIDGAHVLDLAASSFAVALDPGRAFWFRMAEGSEDPARSLLGDLLSLDGVRIAVADAKRTLAALSAPEVPKVRSLFDTTIASYCLQPGVAAHDLDSQVLRRFGIKKSSGKDILGTGKKQKTFAEIDDSVLRDHACEEADFALRLMETQEPELDELAVRTVFEEIEMPLVPVLLAMEREGIAVDRQSLGRLSAEMGARMEELRQRIYGRAGEEFNLNSNQQIGRILFDVLEVHEAAGIKTPRKTPKGQYKTDHDVLEKLAAHHEVPQMLLEWRMLAKLKGTYVDSLPQMIHPRSGRIHTTFNQSVAATGRLSSDNPNLQNIPIRTREGQKVRAAFVARARDHVLMSADYSQIELRILAHLSGDKALVESFQRGEDIHARTAAIVNGMLPEMVTSEMRNQAKVVNYGLMYGMGASRLAAETGMTPPQARKFIDAYFRALPGVKRYLDGSLERARKDKEVRTMFGRRRPLPDIDSTNASLRIAAENMAVNTPIQGAAADIVKRAMLRVHEELRSRGLGARMILQVHDELVLDVPEQEVAEVRTVVREAMMRAADLIVPLEVSIKEGSSWLDAH